MSVFDVLTCEQKLALLAEVGSALRDEDIPAPRHTAANEGAIAAVISMVRLHLELELDVGEGNEIRRILLALCDRTEQSLPAESSTDLEKWCWLLKGFEGRVFWDRDFEMGDTLLDMPPEEARVRMQLLRIDQDYYLTLPGEPDDARLAWARQTLRRLLNP